MENSHKFFSNKSCIHFPCHDMPEDANLNCLFCYCPLYPLGTECGGVFKWVEFENIKMKLCMDCTIPHLPNNYDYVINKLTDENISKMFGA